MIVSYNNDFVIESNLVYLSPNDSTINNIMYALQAETPEFF